MQMNMFGRFALTPTPLPEGDEAFVLPSPSGRGWPEEPAPDVIRGPGEGAAGPQGGFNTMCSTRLLGARASCPPRGRLEACAPRGHGRATTGGGQPQGAGNHGGRATTGGCPYYPYFLAAGKKKKSISKRLQTCGSQHQTITDLVFQPCYRHRAVESRCRGGVGRAATTRPGQLQPGRRGRQLHDRPQAGPAYRPAPGRP